MREPEFIPDWYRARLRRGRRLRAAANATLGAAALGVAWLAFAPGRAPAVGASATAIPTPAAPRSYMPAGAGRALRTLQRLAPSGVAISAISFDGTAGATTVRLRCEADDAAAAGRFVEAVRAAGGFREVTEEITAPADFDRAGVVVLLTFQVVPPAEAP